MKKRHWRGFLFFTLVSMALVSLIPSCRTDPGYRGNGSPGKPGGKSAAESGATSLEEAPDILTILAAGDNLYHDVLYKGYLGKDGYNFDSIYDEIKPMITAADLAFINQETVFAGETYGFSGYPQFNTPKEAGIALVKAGFSIINQATNHIMDKGEKGVFNTMDFWDTQAGATYLGIHRSQEARKKPVIVEKNNIRLGFLSYTYGTNGLAVPKDKPYLVSLINRETMAAEIDSLRPLCDFLIVSMHWGEEYKHEYNSSQKELGDFLAEHLVDLIIGHHPHVVQPVDSFPRPDGGKTLCFYSLGNFMSGQSRLETVLGALMYVKLKKTDKVSIEEAAVIPTVTHYESGFTGFKVLPLYAYTEELAAKHHIGRLQKELTLNYLNSLAKKVFDEKALRKSPFGEKTEQSR